jgi:hypothetical protein
MTLKWKRFALGLALTLAFIYSVPVFHLNGLVPFPNNEKGLVGLRCNRLQTTNKIASLIFGGVILISAVVIIVALICLYFKIGYIIFTHFKLSESACKSVTSSKTGIPDTINHSQATVPGTNGLHSDAKRGNYSIEMNNTKPSESSPQTSENTSGKKITANKGDVNPYMSSVKQRKERKNQRVVYKFTLMFMLITIIFLVCYFPQVIIALLEARIPNFWEEFSDSARAGVLFLSRVYIINYIANPIIYAFLDEKFAKEIKSLFKICK